MKEKNQTVFEFKVLKKVHAEDYKKLRLMSLQESPNSFMGDYERELRRDMSSWTNELLNQYVYVLGAFIDSEIVGVTSILESTTVQNTCISTGTFVLVNHRSLGLFQLMAEQTIAWCKQSGYKYIEGSHREGNQSIQKIMLQLGFQLFKKKMSSWNGGIQAYELMYRKSLHD